MSETSRRRLAALQESLLRSLTGTGPPPEEVDPERLELAATSLAVKRARSVALAWPGLAEALGPRFSEEFAAFAAVTTLPALGGPLADGMAFARWLLRRGPLPAPARLDHLVVSLRYDSRPEGLVPRRGPALKWAWIDPPGRFVVAARWWPGREAWLRLPMPFLSSAKAKDV
ncbi:MAG: hypothetical protein U0790_22560 [Isosphaeraceae bacterium]